MTIVRCNNHACKHNSCYHNETCTVGICTEDEIWLDCEYQYEFTCTDNTIGE